MSARITKDELIAINARLSAEIAALRAELSAAKAQCTVLSELASDMSSTIHHAAQMEQLRTTDVRPQTEHEYPSREEAVAACKRLAASEHNKRAVFSVVGTTIIARARAH